LHAAAMILRRPMPTRPKRSSTWLYGYQIRHRRYEEPAKHDAFNHTVNNAELDDMVARCAPCARA